MSNEPEHRVAFIAGEYPKASETFILRELRGLRQRGLDFVVVATKRLADIREADGIDAPVLLRPPCFSLRSLMAELRFAFTHPLRYIDLMLRLFRGHWRHPNELARVMTNVPRALAVGYELRRLGVTRVHALWASLPATLGWIIARSLDVEFSFAAHSRDVYVDGRMLKEKVELARRVIVCSRSAAERLKDVVGERAAEKITLVHHGIEPERLPPRSKSPGTTILAAGRFVPKKGFDVLIKACAALARRGRDVHCVIVGDGPMKKRLEDLIKRAGARGVEMKPWMPHDALMELLADAAVVVVPSVVTPDGDRDGIPNIILEAMAIGVPVVASDVGGVSEVVIDGETGFLVEPGDRAKLSDKIRRVTEKAGRSGDKTGQKSDITGRARELIGRKWTLSEAVSALERLLLG